MSTNLIGPALKLAGAIWLFLQAGLLLQGIHPVPMFWWLWGAAWAIALLLLHVIELRLQIRRLKKLPT